MRRAIEAVVTSLVMEGVFERFPKLRVVLVEAGFVWVPSLCWRLDRLWERMRDEVPHLTRPPSEYIRQNIWYTTQPIEEPANPEHLKETIDWIGWDRLLFSTDYPHWDYDDPNHAFKFKMTRGAAGGVVLWQRCRGLSSEHLAGALFLTIRGVSVRGGRIFQCSERGTWAGRGAPSWRARPPMRLHSTSFWLA